MSDPVLWLPLAAVEWPGRVGAVERPSTRFAAVLRLFIPGTLGAVGVEWVAEHVDLEPPNYFSDVMVKGPMRSWLHQHRFSEPEVATTRILDEVSYELPIPELPIPGLPVLEKWSVEKVLGRTFEHRNRQLRDDLDFHAATRAAPDDCCRRGHRARIDHPAGALLSI